LNDDTNKLLIDLEQELEELKEKLQGLKDLISDKQKDY